MNRPSWRESREDKDNPGCHKKNKKGAEKQDSLHKINEANHVYTSTTLFRQNILSRH